MIRRHTWGLTVGLLVVLGGLIPVDSVVPDRTPSSRASQETVLNLADLFGPEEAYARRGFSFSRSSRSLWNRRSSFSRRSTRTTMTRRPTVRTPSRTTVSPSARRSTSTGATAEELRPLLDQSTAYTDSSRDESETVNPVPLSADQYPQVVQAYRINEHTSAPYLELANLLSFPVLIQDIHWVNSLGRPVAWQPDTTITLPMVLPASPPADRLSRSRIPYKLPERYPVMELIVITGLQSHTGFNRHTALPYVPALTSRPHTGRPTP